jgi:Flp pilus assembly protein TadB
MIVALLLIFTAACLVYVLAALLEGVAVALGVLIALAVLLARWLLHPEDRLRRRAMGGGP